MLLTLVATHAQSEEVVMSDPYEDDDTEYLQFDGEAAEKAGLGGIPIEDLTSEQLDEIERISKGE